MDPLFDVRYTNVYAFDTHISHFLANFQLSQHISMKHFRPRLTPSARPQLSAASSARTRLEFLCI